MAHFTRSKVAIALVTGLLCVMTAASAAWAEPSAADKEIARGLVIDGRAKFAAKDYAKALEAFQTAHSIMHVPTTGLDLAKTQEALGMLIEARAVALEVTRMPSRPGEPTAFTNARPEALALLERVAPRIPSVLIVVQGLPPGTTPAVVVDGNTIPASSLSSYQAMNPGARVIEVSAPNYTTEKRSVTLKEGATEKITFSLVQREKATPASPFVPTLPEADSPRATDTPQPVSASHATPEKPTEAKVAVTAQQEPDRSASPGIQMPAWALAAGAVGIAALGAGAAFAVDYVAVRSKVADECPGHVCDPRLYSSDEAESLAARWNRDLGLSIGLGAAGLAGIGAAVIGVITAKKGDGSIGTPTTTLGPWTTPKVGGGVVLRGSF